MLAAALVLVVAAPAVAAPPPLSRARSPSVDRSAYGSGNFGSWGLDRFGLPFFRYRVNEATDPKAKQPELAGGTQAQHQVGNDHLMAAAFNDGYLQLWSQDRLSQWTNLWQPANRHYSGGYGYLRVGKKIVSSLYLDRPRGVLFQRDFGVGYYRKHLRARGIDLTQVGYSPYGDDPVLLDDVTLRNTTHKTKRVSWFEYWDVNPYNQSIQSPGNRGVGAASWNRKTRTLRIDQTAGSDDANPLSIFSAALHGPVKGFETSLDKFFGAGTRARPAEVARNRLSGGLAGASATDNQSHALFAFRAPVKLRPGRSVTLRYIYGFAHHERIAKLVSKYRRVRRPLARSERAWYSWLPKADFGRGRAWVARELVWDAYLLRSASMYEELCGHHTITQGGYYQYGFGYNLGFRSWPHYALPMVYTDPSLAREILRYSIGFQPAPQPSAAQFPYGSGPMCERVDLGTSNDLDFWLLLAAGEYGLGTRDTKFFDEKIPYKEAGGSASAWDHIKVAYRHQESLLGPHGGYLTGPFGSTGDWSDFSTEFLQMTESMLVTAQLAYAYPKLAEVADLRGDHAFASELRASGARNLATLRREWTGRGWYSRAYSGLRQVGQGVIFGEPQPWAILAGAPQGGQASTLVGNIRRFLDGVGAPKQIHGPAVIGTAITPARNDPDITERGPTPGDALFPLPDFFGVENSRSTMDNASEWVGGTWFDVNGWLTWALSTLDGRVPNARGLAWSEYTRNTLANHARHFPNHWDGTISVDDACEAFYSQARDFCGVSLSTAYAGQITEQPTWMVMDAIRLAGVTATQAGYRIAPRYPFTRFSLRFPQVGVAAERGRLRGYFRPQRGGSVQLTVELPAGTHTSVIAWSGGRKVARSVDGRTVVFRIATRSRRLTDWAVTWR
ncbi:MAG: hypothetical protein JOZ25_12195 [Actinobacteria bacterium]|nr:hypothetical protein [Actinomycetota bacterium]